MVNSATPDQTPHNTASYQGLHCLHSLQEFLYIYIYTVIIKLTRHTAIGNRPVQRVVVEQSTPSKWVKVNMVTTKAANIDFISTNDVEVLKETLAEKKID